MVNLGIFWYLILSRASPTSRPGPLSPQGTKSITSPNPAHLYWFTFQNKVSLNLKIAGGVAKRFILLLVRCHCLFICRPLTKQPRESNPGRLGGKRERFLCAMPSPQNDSFLYNTDHRRKPATALKNRWRNRTGRKSATGVTLRQMISNYLCRDFITAH